MQTGKKRTIQQKGNKVSMEFVYAPMEGITGYIFRNVRSKFYPDVTAYYTPFISPDEHSFCGRREYQDILPEHNEGIHLIPQIMANKSECFIRCARELEKMGYTEVNLNLGCPSGTVFSKHKGSGMLACQEELEQFLDDIYSALTIPVSIKTRIGVTDPDEFYELLEIYNKFPMKELIIHPRVRAEFYKKIPHLDMYAYAVKESKHPLCYNGNIFSVSGYQQFMNRFPDTEKIMLGRGLLANPGLIGEIKGGSAEDGVRMKAFLDELFIEYEKNCPGEKPLLFKLKEQWYYMASLFPDHQRLIKKIRKAQHKEEYKAAVDRLFAEAKPETTFGFYFA